MSVLRLDPRARPTAKRVVAAFDQLGPLAIGARFERLTLYRSDTLPEGARYTSLFEAPFGGVVLPGTR